MSQATCQESLTLPTHIEAINKCWFSTPLELFKWKCVHWKEWKSKTFYPTTLGYDVYAYIFSHFVMHMITMLLELWWWVENTFVFGIYDHSLY